MRAPDRNQRQRQWQLQLQVVSTPLLLVTRSRTIHRCGHSDMTCCVFPMGRLLVHYKWTRWPCMNASDMEMVSYATWCVAKALAEAPHWQILVKYWNNTVQQNNIWSIAFEVCTKESLQEVIWSNGPRWILHTQTGTRFEHMSIRLKPVLFNHQGSTKQSIIIFTTLNPTQSIWNSLFRFWQTITIMLL